MRKNNGHIVACIPFLIICVIVLYSWFEFITTDYSATWRHYVALFLVGFNAAVYFVRFREAVFLTGGILVLGIFNLLSFFVAIERSGIVVMGVPSPQINLWSLLLLAVYGVINYRRIIEWYLDIQEERDARRKGEPDGGRVDANK